MANVLSIVSIVIAVLFAGWTIYRDLINKGNIYLNCVIVLITLLTKKDEAVEHNYVLGYEMTNNGKQPIIVTKIGYKEREKDTDSYPTSPLKNSVELLPNRFHVEYVSLDILDKNPSTLYVIDSLGKKHRMKKSSLRKLLDTYKKGKYERVEQNYRNIDKKYDWYLGPEIN